MAQKPNGTLTLSFLHPRDSSEFKAEIGERTTGSEAIAGLVQSKFLEPASGTRGYAMHHERTGKQLSPSQPLVASGVLDNDRIAVVETNAGARSR